MALLITVMQALAAAALLAQTAPAQVTADDAISVTTPTLTLSGSLRLPAANGKVPVALIIAGSGPTNRDGNSRMLPGNNNGYKLLAEALAAEGIASVRYDKRGIGDSVAPGMKESDLRFEMYVDDAAAWIAKLRSDLRFSTITVIGHSEGSLIGMLAAGRAKADAYVSIAGIARPAGQILRDQLRPQIGSMAELWQQNETILSSLEAGKTVDPLPSPFATVPGLAALYRPSVQPYMISWLKYTPATEIAKLSMPILILQGTTDIQVTPAEARALNAAAPNAQLVVIEG
ncbi:MAG TPA: alpha/beta fold hydrolase, partial [Vicinamibacterales bacterium]|nr:alpha/beta fold hydrolase [Vicinamibacterales bacterium]